MSAPGSVLIFIRSLLRFHSLLLKTQVTLLYTSVNLNCATPSFVAFICQLSGFQILAEIADLFHTAVIVTVKQNSSLEVVVQEKSHIISYDRKGVIVPSLLQLIKPQYVTCGLYYFNILGLIPKVYTYYSSVPALLLSNCVPQNSPGLISIIQENIFLLTRVLNMR